MTFDATTISMLKTAIWETFYMVALSSLFAYVIGLPFGIILVVTDNGGIYPIPWLQKILGLVINLLRSVPFLILLFIGDCDSSDHCRCSLHCPRGGILLSGD